MILVLFDAQRILVDDRPLRGRMSENSPTASENVFFTFEGCRISPCSQFFLTINVIIEMQLNSEPKVSDVLSRMGNKG